MNSESDFKDRIIIMVEKGTKRHKKARFLHILIKNDAKQQPRVVFSLFRLCFISCVSLNCVKDMPPGSISFTLYIHMFLTLGEGAGENEF